MNGERILKAVRGRIEVFVRLDAGAEPGPLEWLCTLEAPAALPLHGAAPAVAFELKADAGAAYEWLATSAGTPAGEALAGAAQLFAAAPAGAAPGALETLAPGERRDLANAGGVFNSGEAVIISSPDDLTLAALGSPDAATGSEPLLLPRRAWAAIGEPASPDGERRVLAVSAVASDDLLTWAATARFAAQLVALALARAETARRGRLSTLAARRSAAARSLGAVNATLARVFSGRTAATATEAVDPLLVQVRRLFDLQKIEAQLPTAAPADGPLLERAAALANAAGVRSRIVALKDGWRHADCGHFMAYDENSGEPVLLVRHYGGYRLQRATGPAEVCDEHHADRLAGFGIAFYRPLPAGKVTAFGLIRHAMAGRGRLLAAMLALSGATALVGLATPVITRYLVDFSIPSAEVNQIVIFSAGLALAGLVAALLQLAQSIALLGLEGHVNQDMECAVWDRLLRLPADFFKRYTVGDLAQRAASINEIRSALSGKVVGSALTALFSVANLAVLFAFNSDAALLSLGLALGAGLLLGGFTVVSLRWQRKTIESQAELAAVTFEIVSAVSKIQTTATESFVMRRWAQVFARLRQQTLRLQLFETGFGTLFGLYNQAAQAAIYAIVGFLVLKSLETGAGAAAMTSGKFIGFMAAFTAFMGGMTQLASTIAELNEIKPMYDRILPILSTPVESAEAQGRLPELRGAIDIVSLTFGYDKTAPVLRDLNLTIRPGEFIALVGGSGSGKSTLLRLLLGFEKPDAGEIRYDGVAAADLDVQALRARLGVVLQHGMLIPGDIYQNIRGVTNATLEEAWAAAVSVGIDQEIRSMPMGMHTLISEGASTLSGGQRQRILLARALVKKPRIVLLDEATSALDNISQGIVAASMDKLAATRIVIAHRLSTVRNADRIIVLDRGTIAEEGHYADLMQRRGPFWQLAHGQAD